MFKPTFIMMVGLPGSGKSAYAEKLSIEHNATVCSSDKIREELCGDENFQKNNENVFKLLHTRIKDYLRTGENVIYDATNISSKRRKAFLSELKKISCTKKCVIMATPFNKCCEWNESRNRVVPYEVIERMYKNWNTPYWFEGWDEILVKTKDGRHEIPDLVSSWLSNHMDYKQDNPYHVLTLGKHCELVGSTLVKDDHLLEYAGYLHDCGKPFTKSFVNSKREKTNVAHYYQHHCTGAYNSLFFAYPQEVDRLDVSILINLHMCPYCWKKDKEHGENTRQKYKKLWGEELYENVMMLHESDLRAH